MERKSKGQLFLEILLSLAVLSVILIGVVSILSIAPKITFFSEKNQTASDLLIEYLNVATSFRYKYDEIKNLSSIQNHYFEVSNQNWRVRTNGEENFRVAGESYKRYFRISDYLGNDERKLLTIYLTSSSTSENMQVITTQWP